MYSRLHHESKYIAIVSHGTQDVSVCNVIVSEADMNGLAYKMSFHFLKSLEYNAHVHCLV